MAGNLSWRVFPLHFRSQHLFTQVRSPVFILQSAQRDKTPAKKQFRPQELRTNCASILGITSRIKTTTSTQWGIISLKPCVCSNYWMTKGIVNISNIWGLQEAWETISISSQSPVSRLDSLCGSEYIQFRIFYVDPFSYSKSQQFSIFADCRLKQLDGDKWNADLQICIFYEKTFISTQHLEQFWCEFSTEHLIFKSILFE